MIASISAKKLPIKVNITASYPLPSRSILCPGRTERALSPPSGAPKNIEGIESKKVCVIAIEIINTEIDKGDVISNRYADRLRTSRDIKFIWIPGIKPVKIPNKQPNTIAIIISKNIHIIL